MVIQDIVHIYTNAFKTCIEVQKKAVGVVSSSTQSLVATEASAAKDVFAAARASFDKARADGARQVARKPQAYLPEGRERLISAYKDTIALLIKTGQELSQVVGNGYKSVYTSVLDSFNGKKGAKSAAKPAARKTASKRTTARKTTANRKAAAGNGNAASGASATTNS